MSIFLKRNDVKIKNPQTGEYQGQDLFTDGSTTQQIQQITQKGSEVLSSIPPTYHTLVTKVDTLEDSVDALNDGGLVMKDEVIADNVTDWLDDHPEATTTVQDGSLTYKKLATGTLRYVTPEMYGAKGDGTTDDTQAWQSAVDNADCLPVVAASSTYKCGQIDVKQNITIDCKYATFSCTEATLFNCMCEGNDDPVTISEAPDYVKNKDYQLENSDTYTGFAKIISNDNVITMRTYYYGGMVANFVNGVCKDCRPVSFSNVSVLKVVPITCTIRNIGTVTHSSDHKNYNYTVKITYGYKCVVENIYQYGEKYNIVNLISCRYCVIRNVSGSIYYTGTVSQYYGIELDDSSEILTIDCNLASDWWHSWTTGGNYFCFNNTVENCTFKVITGGTSLVDHNNAIGTIVKNCDLDGCVLSSGGKVINARIYSRKQGKTDSRLGCVLQFGPNNLTDVNNFFVDNVEFVISDFSAIDSSRLLGIQIVASAQTTDNDYIVNDVTIKNIRANIKTGFFGCFKCSPSSEIASSFTFVGNLVIDNAIGMIHPNALVTFDSSCCMEIHNCLDMGIDTYTVAGAYVEDGDSRNRPIPKTIIASNSTSYFTGRFDYIKLSNVKKRSDFSSLIGASQNIKSGKLEAINVDRISGANLLQFDYVKMQNMKFNDNYFWVYAMVHPTLGNIYGRVEQTGIVNKELESSS